MGHEFEHIDDLEVVRRIIGSHFVNVEHGKDNILDAQTGKSITLDETWELIPVDTSIVEHTLLESKKVDCVLWEVYAFYPIHGGYMDPPEVDEVLIGEELTLQEAMEEVMKDALRLEIEGHLEAMMHENIGVEEKLHPENAWPTCMLEEG